MTRLRTRAACDRAAAEDMRVTARTNWPAVNRLARERRAHLDTLSPERQAELQQEWNND